MEEVQVSGKWEAMENSGLDVLAAERLGICFLRDAQQELS
jgi:hypothetical protein